jgi:DASS family divalent anion:Na+ symporter
MNKKKWINLIISAAIGAAFFLIPAPAGLELPAWHIFGIFIATIYALITKPLPMGSVSMIAITALVLTKTLKMAQALSGFSNTTIWLIVMAFFISRGIIKTGLGERIAYILVGRFGKKTLGLAYSLVISDCILSPAMPSNTARPPGVLAPIVKSLCMAFDSDPARGTENRMGAYLYTTVFQCDMICSAMFMTAMAANPMCVSIAAEILGINISWGGWFLAALVPGLVSLVLIPLIVLKTNPPEIKNTPEASEISSAHLQQMGPLKQGEKIMIGVFFLLLGLWIFGSSIGIDATAAAFVGFSVLLITEVLSWEDVKNEKGAWDTLVWFSALVMMASFLNSLGFIPWFSELMADSVAGLSWLVAFMVLAVIFFYSHYLFASATAHVSAMYGAFIAVMVRAGAPAMISALLLGFISNLFGCLTHYGAGPAPVFFGGGYVSQSKWWVTGFIISLVDMVIWGGLGMLWWKVLGLW